MRFKPILLGFTMILPAVFAGGCTSTSVELDTAQHQKIIQEDLQALQKPSNIPKEIALSIDEALDIAVEQNLDARVSALEYLSAQDNVTLEKIRALPSMEYTLSRTGRSNFAASRSLSLATGQESLEPSVSANRYRTTRDLTVNWNLIDAASALMQAKSASNRADIAEERYAKVMQNIHRDVYAAYWRARTESKTGVDTTNLVSQAKAHIVNIDKAISQKLISKSEAYQRKAPYLESLNILESLQNESKLAQIELKSLLNLPQDTKLRLVSDPPKRSKIYSDLLKADIETLEMAALENRPEMREAFIERNITIRETKLEIIRTIPGAEAFFGRSTDTNQFLSNNTWDAYSGSLVQNITNLLTFPDRYLIARKNEDMSEARRVTLAAALLAQVHIARHGLAYSKDQAEMASQEEEAAQFEAFAAQKRQHSGQIAMGDVLLARMQAQEKKLESYQALAAEQDAYAALVNTLGMDAGRALSFASLTKHEGGAT